MREHVHAERLERQHILQSILPVHPPIVDGAGTLPLSQRFRHSIYPLLYVVVVGGDGRATERCHIRLTDEEVPAL